MIEKDGIPFLYQIENFGQSSVKICEICEGDATMVADTHQANYYVCEACARQYSQLRVLARKEGGRFRALPGLEL